MAIEFENRSKKVLVNKSFEGGQAGPTQWITVPHGTTAELAEQKRRVGSLAWNDDTDQLEVDNGSGFAPAGGGSGDATAIQGVDVSATAPTDGQALVYDSGTDEWVPTAVSADPGGSDTWVQFNDGGAFGGSPNFTWTGFTNRLSLNPTIAPTGKLYIEIPSADDLIPSISLRNGNSPADYGFDIHHYPDTNNGDLTINRVTSGTSIEAFRIKRDTSEVKLASALTSGPGNVTVSGVGAWAHGLEGAISGGSIIANGQGSEASGFISSGINKSIEANGAGAKAFGSMTATTGTHIYANGGGSIAHGTNDNYTGSMTAGGEGSIAGGYMLGGFPGAINASGHGSIAHGRTELTGTINASAEGSLAIGWSFDGGQINSSGYGSIAAGSSDTGGQVNAANGLAIGSASGGALVESQGGLALGSASGAAGRISAASGGAVAIGVSQNEGVILGNASGALAMGQASDAGSRIRANDNAAHAHGHADLNGHIDADGIASHASGMVTSTNDGVIAAYGIASTAKGYVDNGNEITANGNASFVVGLATEGNHGTNNAGAVAFGDSNQSLGTLSASFGLGHTNASYAALMIGQYGSVIESGGSWNQPESAFIIGGGTSLGSPANIFRITKGGHVLSNSAQATVDPGGDAGAGAVAIANPSATDKAGRVRVTTGTGANPGQLIEITFATPYTNAPSISLTPEGDNARNLTSIGLLAVGPSGFVIAASTVADATEYDFTYQVIGLE